MHIIEEFETTSPVPRRDIHEQRDFRHTPGSPEIPAVL